jgi:DNA-directed RNA polymerase specialized sigma24 family protein
VVNDSIDHKPFPLTPWTLIGQAGNASDDAARQALATLLTRYLPALRAHLILHRRLSSDRADDLIQGFVSQKVLEQNLLARTDRTRGRFRSFLLKSLDYFAIDELRKQQTRESMLEPESEDRPIDEHADPGSIDEQPSRAFDVAWARQVIAQAVELMRQQCDESRRADLWGVFEQRVLKPALDGAAPMEYDELVRRFELRSPAQASNVLMTAKRMFARTLRGVIAEYAQDQSEIDDEMNDIRQILAGS